MSTQLVILPVLPSEGAGPAMDSTKLGSLKNILATSVKGTLNIEASAAGGGWCQVATFKEGALGDKKVTVVCSEMRVSGTKDSQGNLQGIVQVISEEATILSIDLPPAPSDGPGEKVDISAFCPLTTVFAGDFDGSGSQWVEVSGDGNHWETGWSFKGDGCKTQEIAAKWARAYGNGATATLSLASENPAGSDCALCDVSIVKDGDLTQMATSDDCAQTLLVQINEMLDLILMTVECD